MADLKALSLKDLQKLAKDIDKAIASAEARQRKSARAAMDKVAKEFGVSVEEVVIGDVPKPTREKPGPKPKTGKAKTGKAKKGKAKFCNPDDPKQTWTGKGRRPAWYLAAVKAGKTDEDLAV